MSEVTRWDYTSSGMLKRIEERDEITNTGYVLYTDYATERRAREKAEEQLSEYIEKEAACCPEDVGFDELIAHLRARLSVLEEFVESVKGAWKDFGDATDIDGKDPSYYDKNKINAALSKLNAGKRGEKMDWRRSGKEYDERKTCRWKRRNIPRGYIYDTECEAIMENISIDKNMAIYGVCMSCGLPAELYCPDCGGTGEKN